MEIVLLDKLFMIKLPENSFLHIVGGFLGSGPYSVSWAMNYFLDLASESSPIVHKGALKLSEYFQTFSEKFKLFLINVRDFQRLRGFLYKFLDEFL
jgi:hypothetical protein